VTLSNAEIYPDNPNKGLNREEKYIRVKTLKRGDSRDSHRKIYCPKDRIESPLQQWLDQGERRASSPYTTESSHLFVTKQKKRMRPSCISRSVTRPAFNVNENTDSPEETIQEVTGYDVHGNTVASDGAHDPTLVVEGPVDFPTTAPEQVTYEPVDGQGIAVRLYTPDGEPVGGVVFIHGGPPTQAYNRLIPPTQTLVQAGFEVRSGLSR
jgi:hypothetical protein